MSSWNNRVILKQLCPPKTNVVNQFHAIALIGYWVLWRISTSGSTRSTHVSDLNLQGLVAIWKQVFVLKQQVYPKTTVSTCCFVVISASRMYLSPAPVFVEDFSWWHLSVNYSHTRTVWKHLWYEKTTGGKLSQLWAELDTYWKRHVVNVPQEYLSYIGPPVMYNFCVKQFTITRLPKSGARSSHLVEKKTLTRDNPPYATVSAWQKGWSHKRGTTYVLTFSVNHLLTHTIQLLLLLVLLHLDCEQKLAEVHECSSILMMHAQYKELKQFEFSTCLMSLYSSQMVQRWEVGQSTVLP